MLSLSARLTADNRLVLARHRHLYNNKKQPRIRSLTLKELRRRTAGSKQPITTLSDALRKVSGSVMLEIIVEERAAALPLLDLLSKHFPKRRDLETVLVSSSNLLALRALRKRSATLQLGMIHRLYALTFLTWHPLLNLSAVGFHRLHVNAFLIDAAHELDLLTYAYTVNRKQARAPLEALGVDAIVTDTPEKFSQ